MDRFNQLAALRDRRLRAIDRMRAAIGAFGPLHKPLYNPFLKPYNKSSKERWSNEEWANATAIARRIEADNRAQAESPPVALRRHPPGVQDADFKVGYLDDKEFNGFIHAQPTVNQTNYNQLREHFGRYPGVNKHQTVQFLKLAYWRLYRAKFLHLAKSTYLYSFRTKDRKKLDKAYDRHMKSDGVKSLQIGPIAEIPSRPTPMSREAAA
ncbi:hypothetical protein B0A48_07329 [Cryoendolithus antarcticus]|uniref:Uncharacterized protein n=1 Tax=Cryoendolithus antarcticus TaxID=1507870 RepID=A0A1V8T8W7_9PEZI|nr:hypothetical protein B0A48_07329 [Cryoendolithus antarcticus]